MGELAKAIEKGLVSGDISNRRYDLRQVIKSIVVRRGGGNIHATLEFSPSKGHPLAGARGLSVHQSNAPVGSLTDALIICIPIKKYKQPIPMHRP
jgi:hypothetical protein